MNVHSVTIVFDTKGTASAQKDVRSLGSDAKRSAADFKELDAAIRRAVQAAVADLPKAARANRDVATAARQAKSDAVAAARDAARAARERAAVVKFAMNEEAKAARNAARAYDEIKSSIFNLRNAIAALGIGALVRDLLQAAIAAQQIRIGFDVAAGSASAGAAVYEQVRAEADRLGLSLQETAQQYSSFAISAKLAGLTQSEIATTFRGVAEAGTVLHLSSERMSLALLALEQAAGKGVVQMEELKRQLGNQIPGAVEIFAQAMGVTVPVFYEMVKAGKVLASDLPKFGAELSKVFGPGLAASVKSAQAELNRVKTAIFELRAAAGEGLLEGIAAGFADLRGTLKADELKASARELGRQLGSALRTAGEAAAFLARNIDLVRLALVALLAVQAAGFVTKIATAFSGLSIAINSTKFVTPLAAQGLNFFGFTAGAVTTALVGLGIALVATAYKMQSYIEKQREASRIQQLELADSANLFNYLKQLREHKGKLTEQEHELAQAIRERLVLDAAAARAEAARARSDLKDAEARFPKEGEKFSAKTGLWGYLGRVTDFGFDQAGKLDELREAANNAMGRTRELDLYLRELDKTIAAVGVASRKTTGDTDELSKGQERARESVAKMVRELERQVEAQRELLASTRAGDQGATREAERRAEIEKAIADARERLAAQKLALDPAIEANIADLAGRLFDLKDAIDSVKKSQEAVNEVLDDGRGKIEQAFGGAAIQTLNDARERVQAVREVVQEYAFVLAHLTEGSIEQERAQVALNSAKADFARILARVVQEEKRLATSGAEERGLQRAKLSSTLEEIRLETQLLGRRRLTAEALLQERDLRAEIVRLVQESVKPTAGESPEAFAKRWLAAAAETRAVLEADLKAGVRAGLREPIRDAANQMREDLTSAIIEFAVTGKASFADLIQSWLRLWANAFAEWLQRWIVTQAKAAAASRAAQIAGGSSGAGPGGIPLASAAGTTGSTAGVSASTLAGAALAAYALFVVYKVFVNDSVKWAEANTRGGSAGNSSRAAAQVRARLAEITKAVDGLAKEFELGMTRIGDVTLGKRGKTYYVKDAENAIGQAFSSAEAAMEYAKVRALQLADVGENIGRLVKAALRGSQALTTEGLKADLDFARLLQNTGLPELQRELETLFNQFLGNWDRAKQLFRNDLPALADALSALGAGLVQSLASTYDQLTGKPKDEAAEAERRRAVYNAQVTLIRAQIEVMVAELEARKALIQAGHAAARAQLNEAEIVLESGRVITLAAALAGQASAEALARIDAQINALHQTLAALPPLINPGEVVIPGGRGGGNSRGDDKKWLEDFFEQLRRSRLSDVGRALEEINDRFKEAREHAHGNAAALAHLNEERKKEIELLIRNLNARARDFINPQGPLGSALTDVDKQVGDLVKSYRDLHKAGEINTKTLRDMVKALREAAQARREQIVKAAATDLLLQLLDATGRTTEAAQLRWQLAVAEYQIKLAELRIAIEKYHIEGINIQRLQDLLNEVIRNGPPAAANDNNGGGTSVQDLYRQRLEEERDAARQLAEDARRLLEGYERSAIDPFMQQLIDLNTDFAQIRRVFGDTLRVQTAYNAALLRIVQEQVRPIEEWLNSISLSDRSPLSAQDRFLEAQRQFQAVLGAVQGGQYSRIDELTRLADQLLEASTSPDQSQAYRDLYAQIRAQMEAIRAQILAAANSGGVLGAPPVTVPPIAGIPGTSPPVVAPPGSPANSNGGPSAWVDPVVSALTNMSNLLVFPIRRTATATENTVAEIQGLRADLRTTPLVARS